MAFPTHDAWSEMMATMEPLELPPTRAQQQQQQQQQQRKRAPSDEVEFPLPLTMGAPRRQRRAFVTVHHPCGTVTREQIEGSYLTMNQAESIMGFGEESLEWVCAVDYNYILLAVRSGAPCHAERNVDAAFLAMHPRAFVGPVLVLSRRNHPDPIARVIESSSSLKVEVPYWQQSPSWQSRKRVKMYYY